MRRAASIVAGEDQGAIVGTGSIGEGADGWRAGGGRDQRRSYQRARAHSRRVRLLKWAIPAGAVLAVGVTTAIAFFNPFASIGGLTLGPVSVSGTRIVMDSPRLTGFQGEGRPYEVIATEASQDVRTPHLIDLRDLRARITMDQAGNVVRVEAETGRFDTATELLWLERDVRVTSSVGYDADLRSALVDFQAGSVVSEEPVRVGIGSGVVEADTMTITEGGAVATFVGSVRSTFVLDQGGLARPP